MQLAMASTTKSLLKGLRYLSHVFESEKEPEMQIGNPTDVKHVAHIGWDGPSNHSTAPSWMNDFKSSPGLESAPECDNSSAKCQSEYGERTRDLPNLPKSNRKSSSEKGSPTKEKPEKTKRRSNKGTSSSRKSKESSRQDLDSTWSVGLPKIPKKSKRKKSKQSGNGGSPRSSVSEFDKMSGYTSDASSVISLSQFDQDKDGF